MRLYVSKMRQTILFMPKLRSQVQATQRKVGLFGMVASEKLHILKCNLFLCFFLVNHFLSESNNKTLAYLQYGPCEHEDRDVEWNFKSAATDWRDYETEGEAAQLGCSPRYLNASAVCAMHKSYVVHIFVFCTLRAQFEILF